MLWTLAVILQSHDVTCEPKQMDDPPAYLVNPHIKLGPGSGEKVARFSI